MTLRIRERGGLRKVGHTTVALAQNPHSGVIFLWLQEAEAQSLCQCNEAPV